MTIGELINELKKFDENKQVLISDEYNDLVECFKAVRTEGDFNDCVFLITEERYKHLTRHSETK